MEGGLGDSDEVQRGKGNQGSRGKVIKLNKFKKRRTT